MVLWLQTGPTDLGMLVLVRKACPLPLADSVDGKPSHCGQFGKLDFGMESETTDCFLFTRFDLLCVHGRLGVYSYLYMTP